MSKHHHAALSREVQDLVKEITTVDPLNWEPVFGIYQEEDGTITDCIDDRKYKSIVEWATANIEQEQTAHELGMSHKRGKFDDEY